MLGILWYNICMTDDEKIGSLYNLLGEVLHLWADRYITHNPNSSAPHSIAEKTFDKIFEVVDATDRYLPYIGMVDRSVHLPDDL